MKKILFTLLFISFIFPLTAQTKAEKKQIKAEQSAKEYKMTNELINSGNFQFEANWATTQKGRRINLIGNPNYLILKNNEAKIDLPFFGQVYSGSIGMSGEGGVIYEGNPENYKVETNNKKQIITIKFRGKGKSDTFDFTLNIFKNGNANLTVTSNNRSSIGFDGRVIPIKEEN